jgi:hypothetical protein
MSDQKDIEQLFIRESLDEHGEYLNDLFVSAIEKHGLIASGDLLSNIYYRIEKRGNRFVLAYTFKGYGRVIEIMFYRRRRNAIDSIRKNLDLWNTKSKAARMPRRKDARWYTRNVYGAQNKLIAKLSYGLTDETSRRLKQIIAQSIENGTYATWKQAYVTGPTTHAG